MTARTIRYRVASQNIVAETFDDEVVVVNLDSGLYFSLEGSAAVCWQLAVAGLPIDDIVEEVGGRFKSDGAEIDSAIRGFLEELTSDGLLAVDTSGSDLGDVGLLIEAVLSNYPGGRTGFSPPVVNRYSDMRQLLLIDPVHMVSDSGWPSAKLESNGDH